MPRFLLTQKQDEFLRENAKGKSAKQLAILLNDEFGTSLTQSQIKSYKKNHKIRSGIKVPKSVPKLLTEEQEQFLRKNVKGKTVQELTEIINKKFGTNFKTSQITAYKKNHKLKSGVDCTFQKGRVPPNKGKPMSEEIKKKVSKGWFKKGQRPRNYKPVGSERVTTDGYIMVKVRDPNVWKLKHHVIWEKERGEIPKDHVILFLDGDSLNTNIENLMLISRSELSEINKWQSGIISEFSEVTKCGVNILRLQRKIREIQKV